MRPIILEITATLTEGEEKYSYGRDKISTVTKEFTITPEQRAMHGDISLKELVASLVEENVKDLGWELTDKAPLPLNRDVRDLKASIELRLKELFPQAYISFYIREGKLQLAGIARVGASNDTENIYHPVDGSYLTTLYKNIFYKVKNFGWTNAQQASDYYEAVARVVEPPISEPLLIAYLDGLGIKYDIESAHTLLPLPEPKDRDGDVCYHCERHTCRCEE